VNGPPEQEGEEELPVDAGDGTKQWLGHGRGNSREDGFRSMEAAPGSEAERKNRKMERGRKVTTLLGPGFLDGPSFLSPFLLITTSFFVRQDVT